MDARWVGFQGGEAGHELVFDAVHRVEDEVGEGLLAEEIPDVFGGVELRAVGREWGKAHVFGDDDIVGCVPAGAVKQHEDEFGRVAPSHFGEEERHGLGIDGGEDETVEDAIVGADCCEGIGVLAHDAAADNRTDASGRPAASWVVDPTETGFVLEHQSNGSADSGLTVYFVRDDLGEFLLNAS